MTSDDKENLAIMVKVNTDYGHYHIDVEIMVVTDDRPVGISEYGPNAGLRDLGSSWYGFEADQWHAERRAAVSWSGMRYDTRDSIDEQRAELMLKTLRKLHRGMQKIYDVDGSALSFAQHLIRVARVFGIKQAIRPGTQYPNGRREWHVGRVLDIGHWAESEMADWIRQGQPEAIAQAS